ncbi:MAG: protein rep [Epulopiscium sp.]|nr:protein rep [Candidatus Epulonipiscium sp.]
MTVTRYYLSQEKWTELWKSSLKVDYMPIVDVRS